MGLGYWWNLDFANPLNVTPWHNCYVLVMIKHFSKWLELMPLPNYNSEGVAYVFLDIMFSMFSAPVEVFTNQSTNFWRDLKDSCEKALIDHFDYFTKSSSDRQVGWMNGVDDETKITKTWPLERPHSRLGFIITMVSHGIWVQSTCLIGIF